MTWSAPVAVALATLSQVDPGLGWSMDWVKAATTRALIRQSLLRLLSLTIASDKKALTDGAHSS